MARKGTQVAQGRCLVPNGKPRVLLFFMPLNAVGSFVPHSCGPGSFHSTFHVNLERRTDEHNCFAIVCHR